MAILNATPLDLAKVITAALPGDRVELADGAYPLLTLTNVRKDAPGVTVTAARGAKPVLKGLKFSNVSGIAVQDVRIDAGQKYAVEMRTVERITLEYNEIHGPRVEQVGMNDIQQGVLTKYSKQVAIRHNDFHDMRIGVGFAVMDGLEIEGNRFRDLAGDAIRGSGRNVVVRGNRATNLYLWNADHIDFIQFSTVASWNEGIVPANILIEGNDYRRGEGHQAQGVFFRGDATMGFENVTIRGNGLVGTNHAGIAITFAKGVRVFDNFVQADTASNPTRIHVADCADVIATGNTTSYDRLLLGRNVGEVAVPNVVGVLPAVPGDYQALDDWRLRVAP